MLQIHFKKILTPVDFSETGNHAFQHVKYLAQKFNSEVTLMHVRESVPSVSVFPSLYEPREELNSKYRELAMNKLDELRNELNNEGVETVHIQYMEGAVAQSIHDYVEQENIDIVVMGTHGAGGLRELFIGSNAFKVVNMANNAVLTVNEKSIFAPYKNIVAPLDDSKFSRAKFPYLAGLAGELGAEIQIVYPKVSDEKRKRDIENYFQQVSKFLEEKQIQHFSKELEGNFAHEIVKFAEYTNADLLVIMSETEMTFAKMLLGGYAQEIVNHSKTPVITLHPEGTGDLMKIFG